MTGKTIGIVAMDGVQLLDVAGPADVFAEANVQAGEDHYEIRLFGIGSRRIRSSSGVYLEADDLIGERGTKPLDTLLVAGAPHLHRRARDPHLLVTLRDMAARARRYGSVCTGAVLLGQAGLLDGKRVTTHWAIADAFRQMVPTARLEIDAIFVADGPLRTAAGVTAGLDLALSMVGEDLGAEVARRVAGQLVMYFRRPGGQRQHSRLDAGNVHARSALQNVQRWVEAHPEGDHAIATMAERAGMSARHFARLFQAEIGVTPAVWVERARIAAARRMLERGEPPKVAATRCGFGDVETFRRSFARQVGVSPATYRKQFGSGVDENASTA